MNVRLDNAVMAVRDAIATAADLEHSSIGIDDDLFDDIGLHPLERESLCLICEEIFGVVVPPDLWRTPLYRTAASLAEWLIDHSNAASWAQAKQDRRKCA